MLNDHHMNNPAGRLLNILEEAKKINPQTPSLQGWCHLLNIKQEDGYLLVGRIGKVFGLADEIFTELSKRKNANIKRQNAWVKQFETALTNTQLSGLFGSFSNSVSDSILDYLSMTSEILSMSNPQPVMPQDKLQLIAEQAEELISLIESSDIPKSLQDYMLHQLKKICIAVDEYQITGASDLIDIVEGTIGKFVIHPELREASKSNSVSSKFWSFMYNTATVMAIVSAPLQITSSASDLELLPKLFEQSGIQVVATSEEISQIDRDVIEGEVSTSTQQ